MRLPKLLIILLMAVAISFGAASSSVVAQSGDPTTIPGLDKPAEQLTTADLKQFVELALGNKITVAQTRSFYDKLSTEQQRVVRDLVESRARSVATPSAPTSGAEPVSPQCDPACSEPLDYWTQAVELSALNNYTSPDCWYQSQYECDTADDTDYVFHFNFPSYNPDGLAWDTDSSALYLTLRSRGGTNLKGFGYLNGNTVSLCIGRTTIANTGGPAYTALHLWIGWRR